ncbi:MAG: translation initiation factor IF-2 subunit gamma [Candidatus Helarchaeota archaeon]|nr:translation initiation factor IF-2 subunit gamma [Candidatus Helarchaeota archaeon]
MPKGKKAQSRQAEVNIGMIGHVDHGKTTLVQSLSGEWTDRHSDEIKRGISIKLGYADVDILKCPTCEPPECYSTPNLSPKNKCKKCGSKLELLRRISFVDAPGHEVFMATTISGAFIMDGAIIVIAANEKCPMPQTREHYETIKITNVKNIIAVQNKIELRSFELNMENYQDIAKFIEQKDTGIPIIPISAIHKSNLDVLLQAIEEKIPTPTRDLDKSLLMYVARSFDIDKPGTKPQELVGGVLGCSIARGRVKVGDQIEIKPGIINPMKDKTKYEPIITEVTSLQAGDISGLSEAVAGGLIGVGTKLDPALTKADSLIGNVVGKPGTLPPTWQQLRLEKKLLERVVGAREIIKVKEIKTKEIMMLNVGIEMTVGPVTSVKRDIVEISLKRPVCAEVGQRVAISRQISGRWRLIGYGTIIE